MMKIRRCVGCGVYTLKASHCGSGTAPAHPPRFNPEDRHARERRLAKGIG